MPDTASPSRRAFISHSSHDDRYVGELTQFLKGLGYDSIFNDSHVLVPDERFWERILGEIAACDVFVLVLSQFSAQSEWVEREILEARRLNRQVLPVRIDQSAVPPVLSGHNLV
ncbi:MAG: toll/interleukin-1 receptor domain-containing protein, partial [Planctomycetaceae bacterium]